MRTYFGAILLLGLLSLSACGGGGDSGGGSSTPAPTTTYTIGGIVSGLAGAGLVLQNNAGNNLTISANGAFAFGTSLLPGAAYSVTVLTQPGSPAQSCAVTGGSGTVAASNITSISIACTSLQAAVIASSFAGSPDFNFDADGAVGPSHYAEITNTGLFVFSLANGKIVYSTNLAQFWLSKMGLPGSGGPGDSHIQYDHATGRWFAISVTNTFSANSSVYVGVSDTSDPSAGWKGLAIAADPSGLRWADYPQLGIDAAAIYIRFSMVAIVNTTPSGVGLLVLPKGDLTGPILSTTHLSRLTVINQSAAFGDLLSGGLPQVDYLGTATDGLLVSPYFYPGTITTGTVSHWTDHILYQKMTAQASGAAALTSWASTPTFQFDSPMNPPPQPNYPVDAGRQPGTGQVLTHNHGKNNVRVGDSLYSVASATVNGRGGILWRRFQLSTNTIVDAGFIGDDTHDYLDSSIAANTNGAVVIAYTRTSKAEYASFYCSAGRQDVSGKLVFGLPTLLRAGTDILDDKAITLAPGFARFSDFSSAVSIHPSMPSHFWVSGAYISGRNQESIWISEIIVE